MRSSRRDFFQESPPDHQKKWCLNTPSLRQCKHGTTIQTRRKHGANFIGASNGRGWAAPPLAQSVAKFSTKAGLFQLIPLRSIKTHDIP